MPPPYTDSQVLKDYHLLQKSTHSMPRSFPVKTDQNREEVSSRLPRQPRLSTPVKTQILELADSYNKHLLRKQQQLLADMALRCREQEVLDMSSSISKKCILEPYEERGREATTYSTSKMVKHVLREKTEPVIPVDHELVAVAPQVQPKTPPNDTKQQNSSPRNDFEKARTCFPMRKVRQSPGVKEWNIRGCPPRLEISYRKGVRPSPAEGQRFAMKPERVNGIIQKEHCTLARSDQLAPLLLPVLKSSGDRNNINSYVNTTKMDLGYRSRSILEASLHPAPKPRQTQSLSWTSFSQAGSGPSMASMAALATGRQQKESI
ncbi:hypothetical protein CAPTEDRAFT_193887 [Capitella teleta]|uniref:Uncharacterized protein n=1 Tax=Capitella teleta TaxID=283909 RepID=R7V546_CAPTE|nr:hypothetical protein CAPTEDRAFT_193887 [Capitella teleta]|eukprot:ELU11481.1 hypothetical protein CAPTEDRAFT_193887 [Capitella teleta]